MSAPTPGYNCRLSIAFTTDKRGKVLAYYWSGGRAPVGSLGRWMRMPLADARLFVAEGSADQDTYRRWGDPTTVPSPDSN